jgi:hypothetical protein
MLHKNELESYIQQLAFPEFAGGMPVTPPLHIPSDTQVFSNLDWLRARFEPIEKNPDEHFHLSPIPHEMFMEAELTGGRYGYRRGLILKPCGTLFYEGFSREMGSLLDLTGLDLARLRYEHQISDDEILSTVMRRAIKCTRLDFCVNINAGTPISARDEWHAGRLETKVRKGIYYEPMGESLGDSLYVGARGSAKFVRIYDKAKELGLLHEVLTRIEMQAIKKTAPILVREMMLHGVKAAGKKAILQHVDFPRLAWYQEALHGASDHDMQLTPREKGNIVSWLNGHVGPAIQKNLKSRKHIEEITEWLLKMENEVMEAKREN